jgi:hypothetical protein
VDEHTSAKNEAGDKSVLSLQIFNGQSYLYSTTPGQWGEYVTDRFWGFNAGWKHFWRRSFQSALLWELNNVRWTDPYGIEAENKVQIAKNMNVEFGPRIGCWSFLGGIQYVNLSAPNYKTPHTFNMDKLNMLGMYLSGEWSTSDLRSLQFVVKENLAYFPMGIGFSVRLKYLFQSMTMLEINQNVSAQWKLFANSAGQVGLGKTTHSKIYPSNIKLGIGVQRILE